MSDSIIKKYYDGLKSGKILATKCNKCGKYTFPPTTRCQHCGRDDLAWTEFSGKGKLMYVSHGMAPPPNQRFVKLAPYAFGHVLLEEGVYAQGIVTNIPIDPETLNEYYEKGPIDVEADIIDVEGLSILAFKTV
jgi:uncharacterized OB-fold protein